MKGVIPIGRIFIIISLLVHLSLFPYASYAKSTHIEVQGFSEAYFIQYEEREVFAPGEMITFQNESYIPLEDSLAIMGYSSDSSGAVITLENLSSTEPFRMTTKDLPKETVVHSSPTFTTNVQADGALIAENQASNILFQKNGDKPFFPASTVKIMTALIALENGQLNDRVKISANIRNLPSDSSTARLNPGETLTLEQLLYAMMLPSGNDAALAIAVHIAGSEAQFVQMMNDRAKELGATKTNFTNSHGYHHPNQQTTAHDLTKIAFELAKHPKILEIMGTPIYSTYVRDTNGNSVARTWRATNQQLHPSNSFYHSSILGGKTGYTSDSLHTLVSFAENGEDLYVTVVLRGDRIERYNDTKRMLNQAIAVKRSTNSQMVSMQIELIENQIFTFQDHEFKENVAIYQNEWFVPISFIEKLTSAEISVSDEQLMKLSINKELMSFSSDQLVLENGRLLVPFRQLFESLGLQVQYDAASNKIYGIQNDLTIELQINSNIAFINHEKIVLDHPIKSVNNITLVPVRLIAEATQAELDWGRGRTIYIK